METAKKVTRFIEGFLLASLIFIGTTFTLNGLLSLLTGYEGELSHFLISILFGSIASALLYRIVRTKERLIGFGMLGALYLYLVLLVIGFLVAPMFGGH